MNIARMYQNLPALKKQYTAARIKTAGIRVSRPEQIGYTHTDAIG